jgi:predicted ATPase
VQTARDLVGPLLGRDSETALITSLLDEVSDSGGRALVLTGEPGIGKSRLLAEAVALADRRAAWGGRWGTWVT